MTRRPSAPLLPCELCDAPTPAHVFLVAGEDTPRIEPAICPPCVAANLALFDELVRADTALLRAERLAAARAAEGKAA